jgi:hypothetical protein
MAKKGTSKGASTGSKGSIRTGAVPGTGKKPKGHNHGGYGM